MYVFVFVYREGSKNRRGAIRSRVEKKRKEKKKRKKKQKVTSKGW
jgi:hypothetical protein